MTTIADRETPDLTAEIRAAGVKEIPNNYQIPNATTAVHWSEMEPAKPPADLEKMSSAELRSMHDELAKEASASPNLTDIAWGIPAEELKNAVITFQQAERDAQRADDSVRRAQQLARRAEQQADIEQPAASAEPVSLHRQADGSYEVRLETGEVFQGSPDEVISKLARAKLDTRYWAEGLNQQLKTLREQTPYVDPQPYGQSDDGESMPDLGGLLLDAAARKLGVGNGDELLRSIDSLLASNQQRQNQDIAQNFHMRCPDFPLADDRAYEILDRVLTQNQWPLTADSLVAAHAYAVRYNLYEPLTAEQIRAGFAPQEPVRRPTPPPLLPSSQPEMTGSKDLWQMSADEIKRLYFDRHGREG